MPHSSAFAQMQGCCARWFRGKDLFCCKLSGYLWAESSEHQNDTAPDRHHRKPVLDQ